MLHSIHTHIVVYIKWADSSSLSEHIYKKYNRNLRKHKKIVKKKKEGMEDK